MQAILVVDVDEVGKKVKEVGRNCLPRWKGSEVWRHSSALHPGKHAAGVNFRYFTQGAGRHLCFASPRSAPNTCRVPIHAFSKLDSESSN